MNVILPEISRLIIFDHVSYLIILLLCLLSFQPVWTAG